MIPDYQFLHFLPNTNTVKIYFSIFLTLAIFERVINTFNNQKEEKKLLKVFHRFLFYLLLAVYLLIVILDIISFYKNQDIIIEEILSGILVYLSGCFIRRNAIRELGKYWSMFSQVLSDQQIIRTGVYAYFKHPYYFAVLLELIGFSLICNSFLGVILSIFLQLPLLLVRIHGEERILRVYGKRMRFIK